MTVRVDLDTIREALEFSGGWAAVDSMRGDDEATHKLTSALAALDRLAGCVILTREEAARLRDFYRLGEIHAALLDARLGEATDG